MFLRGWGAGPGHGRARMAVCRAYASAAASSHGMRLAGGGLLTAGGGVLVYSQSQKRGDQAGARQQDLAEQQPWLQALQQLQHTREVLSPGQMLRQHPLGRLVTSQDHLFEPMVQSGQIVSIRCFYQERERRFHSVVQLGTNVCGYPGVVHGGLTAALLDETLGGCAISVWRAGGMGVQPPALTAHLSVDYKQKVPAGSTVLCSADVESIEGRKMWLRASMTDGEGIEFATARALFVAPRIASATGLTRVMSSMTSGGAWLAGLVPRFGGRAKGGDGSERGKQGGA